MPLRASFWAAFAFAGAFYVLLVDSVALPELYAGAVATALAVIGSELARRNGLRGGAARLRWVARGWHAVARLPADVFWVSLAAMAQLVSPARSRGVLRAVRFDHGQADDPADIGRRALAEALGSFTPNTIVIGIDQDRNLILVHQLRRSGGPEGVDVLGLG
jgi:multisubunit Na+/H+ antiporter MnhE subunit